MTKLLLAWVLNTIVNQSALITIESNTASGSAASDESDKTFTVTGLDMSGNTLVEVITGPEVTRASLEDGYLNQFTVVIQSNNWRN